MLRLSPSDMLFLLSETRQVHNHVGGLLPFSPPEGADPDWARGLLDELRDAPKVHSPWNLKLRHPDFIKTPTQSWVEDDDIELDYHVRRLALPSPGDERELGVLVSRLHTTPIDFHHPPWEATFIEGLEGDRFALFAKMHHSLIDGFTGMKLLQRSLSADPDDRDTPLFFLQHHPLLEEGQTPIPSPMALVREQLDAARDVTGVMRELWRAVRRRQRDVVSPLQAPASILNRRIGRNRRFATQRYGLDHMKALAKVSGGTLNDIVLALSATALRRFLLELGALPGRPLVAMLPVNIRPKDDPGGGNAVGAILASLATHIADPIERLESIIASTQQAKRQLEGLSRSAILQYSALTLLPAGIQHLTGSGGFLKPQFNVVISNVQGPAAPLYFRGARLEAVYPASIPIHGQALNITCQSYAGTLCFGFTGCRDSLPRMQHLAVYMGEAVAELSERLGCQP